MNKLNLKRIKLIIYAIFYYTFSDTFITLPKDVLDEEITIATLIVILFFVIILLLIIILLTVISFII